MLGIGRRSADVPSKVRVTPLPEGVTPADRQELAAAKARVHPKWEALDDMLRDYRAADGLRQRP